MVTATTKELQGEFLAAVRKSQETVLDTISTWVKIVQSVTSQLPDVHVPLTDKFPKPEEVVTSAYDFAEQLLAGQRRFADDIVKAAAPLLPGDASSTPKATAAQ